jgi:hypothetical protein
LQQRVVSLRTMEVALRYAGYVLSLSGATTLFVLPNAVVIQYSGQVILVIARDEQGD